jgi:hypothetical protein
VAFGGRAGGGGRAGSSSGGTAGSEEEPEECPESTDAFCDALEYNSCPERVDGRWQATCDGDVDTATYEECDGGVVRFYSQVGFENDATLVYDADGKLLYGDGSYWDGSGCSVGSRPELRGCRLCYFCFYDPEEENGDAGGGQGGGGGEGGGRSFCATSPDGFVSLP